MGFRKSYECETIYSQYAFLFLATIIALVGGAIYIITARDAGSNELALYYIFTFLAIISFGRTVWEDDITNNQVIGILLIILGLAIWAL